MPSIMWWSHIFKSNDDDTTHGHQSSGGDRHISRLYLDGDSGIGLSDPRANINSGELVKI